MKYKILRTLRADNQLREIIFYIAENTGSTDVALKYLNKLEKAISQLEDFPLSGVKPKYAVLRKQGYLVLIVEKHLIFYKVDSERELVIIYAVVDSRRAYKNLIL